MAKNGGFYKCFKDATECLKWHKEQNYGGSMRIRDDEHHFSKEYLAKILRKDGYFVHVRRTYLFAFPK